MIEKAAAAFLPLDDAVTVTAPLLLSAVTSPLPFTLATPVLLLPQVILPSRPISTFPLASRKVAASWTVCPVGRLTVAGVTLTDATGAGV